MEKSWRGEVEAAHHAAGEGAGGVGGALAQADDVEDGIDALVQLTPVEAVDAAEEGEVVAGAEGGVEGQLLGDEAEAGADACGFADGIDAV
ncbi:MAG: hypothetical protein HY905_17045, partial [Deltaproteobacteria bacterium]|nr:hypothetical protein [Deltaproteobacteria bacterium]